MQSVKSLFCVLFALVMMLLLPVPKAQAQQPNWCGVGVPNITKNWPASPVTNDTISFKIDFWWYPNTLGTTESYVAGEGIVNVTGVDVTYWSNTLGLVHTISNASVGYATNDVYLRCYTPGMYAYGGISLLTDTYTGKTDTVDTVTISYGSGVAQWCINQWTGHLWDYVEFVYHYNWTSILSYSNSPTGGVSGSYSSGDLTSAIFTVYYGN